MPTSVPFSVRTVVGDAVEGAVNRANVYAETSKFLAVEPGITKKLDNSTDTITLASKDSLRSPTFFTASLHGTRLTGTLGPIFVRNGKLYHILGSTLYQGTTSTKTNFSTGVPIVLADNTMYVVEHDTGFTKLFPISSTWAKGTGVNVTVDSNNLAATATSTGAALVKGGKNYLIWDNKLYTVTTAGVATLVKNGVLPSGLTVAGLFEDADGTPYVCTTKGLGEEGAADGIYKIDLATGEVIRVSDWSLLIGAATEKLTAVGACTLSKKVYVAFNSSLTANARLLTLSPYSGGSGSGQSLTDAQIADKAFSNPPSDLTTAEKTAVRTAIGAGTGSGTALSDTQIGDKAFSNPPNDLSATEKGQVRTAIGAGVSNQNLTDAQVGDKAFSNPPNNLSTTEKGKVRTAIGAGISNQNLTDAQVGDKAFSNPPSDLTSAEKTAVRSAIGAGTGDGSGSSLTDAQIGDKAFSNPPSDLTSAEKTAVRSAIGAGTGDGSGTSLSDSEIGDKAFSNPPSDLSAAEKTSVRTAIGASDQDLSDTQIGDKAFSNPPSDLSATEKTSVRTAIGASDQDLSDTQIGDKAFSNPPSDLSTTEKTSARSAIGAGTSSQNLTDTQVGDKAFSNPPSDLSATEKTSVRTAIGAGTSNQSLTDAQIGDKAFSNPPSGLTDAEKTAVRSAIGTGGGQSLTDAQVGDKAFSNPPSDLSVAEQKSVRDAITAPSIETVSTIPSAAAGTISVGDVYILTADDSSVPTGTTLSSLPSGQTGAKSGDVFKVTARSDTAITMTWQINVKSGSGGGSGSFSISDLTQLSDGSLAVGDEFAVDDDGTNKRISFPGVIRSFANLTTHASPHPADITGAVDVSASVARKATFGKIVQGGLAVGAGLTKTDAGAASAATITYDPATGTEMVAGTETTKSPTVKQVRDFGAAASSLVVKWNGKNNPVTAGIASLAPYSDATGGAATYYDSTNNYWQLMRAAVAAGTGAKVGNLVLTNAYYDFTKMVMGFGLIAGRQTAGDSNSWIDIYWGAESDALNGSGDNWVGTNTKGLYVRYKRGATVNKLMFSVGVNDSAIRTGLGSKTVGYQGRYYGPNVTGNFEFTALAAAASTTSTEENVAVDIPSTDTTEVFVTFATLNEKLSLYVNGKLAFVLDLGFVPGIGNTYTYGPRFGIMGDDGGGVPTAMFGYMTKMILGVPDPLNADADGRPPAILVNPAGTGASVATKLYWDGTLYRFGAAYADVTGTPTDAQIGDKAFSNPPSDLSTAEKTAVRTAIGAGTGGGSATIGAGSITTTMLGDEIVTEPKLDIHNAAASGKHLGYTSNGMEWVDPPTPTPISVGGEPLRYGVNRPADGTLTVPSDQSWVTFATVTIPKLKTSSKVLVQVTGSMAANQAGEHLDLKWTRGTALIEESTPYVQEGANKEQGIAFNGYDVGPSAGSNTYTLQIRQGGNQNDTITLTYKGLILWGFDLTSGGGSEVGPTPQPVSKFMELVPNLDYIEEREWVAYPASLAGAPSANAGVLTILDGQAFAIDVKEGKPYKAKVKSKYGAWATASTATLSNSNYADATADTVVGIASTSTGWPTKATAAGIDQAVGGKTTIDSVVWGFCIVRDGVTCRLFTKKGTAAWADGGALDAVVVEHWSQVPQGKMRVVGLWAKTLGKRLLTSEQRWYFSVTQEGFFSGSVQTQSRTAADLDEWRAAAEPDVRGSPPGGTYTAVASAASVDSVGDIYYDATSRKLTVFPKAGDEAWWDEALRPGCRFWMKNPAMNDYVYGVIPLAGWWGVAKLWCHHSPL